MQTSFFKARLLPVKFFINSYQTKNFVVTQNGVSTGVDITTYTWELFVKEYAGSRTKLISLTIHNGLTFPAYTTNEIDAVFTAAQTNIKEGEYYWELRRTDLIEPWLNGPATFIIGNTDSQ